MRILRNLILLLTTDQASALSAAALVTRLASRLEGIKGPSARACVLRLVGRHPGEGGLVGPENLQTGVRNSRRLRPKSRGKRLASGTSRDASDAQSLTNMMVIGER